MTTNTAKKRQAIYGKSIWLNEVQLPNFYTGLGSSMDICAITNQWIGLKTIQDIDKNLKSDWEAVGSDFAFVFNHFRETELLNKNSSSKKSIIEEKLTKNISKRLESNKVNFFTQTLIVLFLVLNLMKKSKS